MSMVAEENERAARAATKSLSPSRRQSAADIIPQGAVRKAGKEEELARVGAELARVGDELIPGSSPETSPLTTAHKKLIEQFGEEVGAMVKKGKMEEEELKIKRRWRASRADGKKGCRSRRSSMRTSLPSSTSEVRSAKRSRAK